MIVCHRYKFIFLKTRKTAGTSIEIGLSRFCSDDDIITPIKREDERTRRQLGYRGPQNFRLSPFRYSRNDWARLVTRFKPARCHNHMPATLVRKWVGEEVWNSYFKFAFERNPWDKMISSYYWRTRRMNRRPTFEAFVHEYAEQLSDFRIYSTDGEVAVNHVGRFENLEQELEAIVRRLGLPERLELPRAKATQRLDKRHYHDVYGPAERQRVEDAFAREIALLGYRF